MIRISFAESDQGQTGARLSGNTDSRFVEIQLQDNGIGIEKSSLEKIFDIFSQLPYNQIPNGGGIGLAYCRKIIRNHGGNITAHSEPGSGTVFSVILPVKQNLPQDFTHNYNDFQV